MMPLKTAANAWVPNREERCVTPLKTAVQQTIGSLAFFLLVSKMADFAQLSMWLHVMMEKRLDGRT